MITIKEFFKYENANAIEVTWVETLQENFIKKEIVDDKEIETVDTKTIEKAIHCQAFADSQIDLLRQTASQFETVLTPEHEEIIADVIKNIVLPTQEELESIAIEKEKQRILLIKAEAGRIIESKYNLYWQLNHPRLSEEYEVEYAWIDAIRAISNKSEELGLEIDEINWEIQ